MQYPGNASEKFDDYEARINEPINASTTFNPNSKENIQKLAETAYPEDSEEQKRYAEKINASLTNYLQGETTIDDLWKFLKEQNCTTTKIIEGILRFFDNLQKEIDISKFTINMQLTGNELTESFKEGRQEKFASTMENLKDLFSSIQQANPNLPPPPNRYA